MNAGRPLEFAALEDELEQVVAQRDEAFRRLHLILSTIYTTHGYLDADGEIDTAAKFRAIERLARIDWDAAGFSEVLPADLQETGE